MNLSKFLVVFFLTVIGHLPVQSQTLVDTTATINQLDSLWKAARELANQKEYKTAHQAIDLMESKIQSIWGLRHAQMVRAIALRAWVFGLNNNFEEALTYYNKAIVIAESIPDLDRNMYARLLRSFGMINRDIGNFEKALGLLIKAAGIISDSFGKTSKDYSDMLFTQATIYYMMGKYQETEHLYLSIKPVFENTVGKSSRDYASLLDNLAMSYRRMGQYEKAEPLYLEAVNIRAFVLGKHHPHYANSLENMGNFYKDLGQIEKSREMLEGCRIIRKAVYGDRHYLYGKILENIAVLLIEVRDYEESEKMLVEAKGIYEESLGIEHPYYLNVIVNLAGLYLELKDTENAEKNYDEALSILEKQTDKEESDYAVHLSNIASFYSKIRKLEKAEALFSRAKLILETYLGKNHPFYIEYLINYGEHCRYKGNSELAAHYFMEAVNAVKQNTHAYVNFLSEPEMEKLIFKNQVISNAIYSFAHETNLQIPKLNIALWNQAFTLKGLLLDKSRTLEFIAGNNQDTVTQEVYADWKSILRSLAAESSKPNFQRDTILIKELETLQNIAEKKLSRNLSQFSKDRSLLSWQDISKVLQPGEASVEFCHYRYGQIENVDSIFYSVLVTCPKDIYPVKLILFEEKQLTSLLEKTGDNAQATTNLYAARSGDLLGHAPSYGKELYNLIWRPLDSLFQKHDIKTVYFSPSGLLHRVSFSALPVNEKKVLSDKYELHQLGSTRSLVVKTPEPVAQNYTAAVFGGVQYDRKDNTPADSTAPEITDNRLWTLIEHPRASSEGGFDYLPGTAQEASSLTRALQAQRVQTQTHTGAQASEEMLKSLGRDTVKSPDILHIATHGFFFSDPEKRKDQRFGEENAFKWNENPLFRSGLALSGANAAWSGQPTPGNIEDGIATAYEISHLNLSNTKLVVLSACESGLGDIKGSEGVYGLQRAFKMAGADYLLVSLWQVPDKETVEFMDLFYKSWLGGKTIHEAFAKAQKKMRKKYKEVYKWGAWVLVE